MWRLAFVALCVGLLALEGCDCGASKPEGAPIATPNPPAAPSAAPSPAPPGGSRYGPPLTPGESYALDAAWAHHPAWEGREVVYHSDDWTDVIVRIGPTPDRVHTRVRFRWDPYWGYQVVEEDEWERELIPEETDGPPP